MPYYNQLYESSLLKFNPFYDVDLTKDGNREGAGENANTEGVDETRNTSDTGSATTADTTSEATHADNWSLYSDTPQGGLNGLIDDNDPLTENNYLTNATRNIDNGTANTTENVTTNTTNTGTATTGRDTQSNGTYSNTEQYLEHIVGKQGSSSYSRMLKEYRDTFLNIDKMIIDDLADLFFNLW